MKEPILKFEAESPKSSLRTTYKCSYFKYIADLCGIEVIIFNTHTVNPFMWSLDCKELFIENVELKKDFKESVIWAEQYIKWRVKILQEENQRLANKILIKLNTVKDFK